MQVNWAAQKRKIKHNSVYCAHANLSVRERERELTEMVDVGLKAILIFMISPFDIPPCLST